MRLGPEASRLTGLVDRFHLGRNLGKTGRDRQRVNPGEKVCPRILGCNFLATEIAAGRLNPTKGREWYHKVCGGARTNYPACKGYQTAVGGQS